MLIYIVLISYLLFSIVALFISTSILVGLVMAKGVPFISLPKQDWVMMCEAAKLLPGQKVYDLGCGKANLLVVAAKQFGARGVGYEISLWAYVWGQARNWYYKARLDLKMSDFFKADISDADVVFTYLFPEVMLKLEDKFRRELKPGAKVVSYGFPMQNISPTETVLSTPKFSSFLRRPIHTSNIYIYQF